MTSAATLRPWWNVLAAISALFTCTPSFWGTSPNGTRSADRSPIHPRYLWSKTYCPFNSVNIRSSSEEKKPSRTRSRLSSLPRKYVRRSWNSSEKTWAFCWYRMPYVLVNMSCSSRPELSISSRHRPTDRQHSYEFSCLGGAVVERWTRDRKVAGSTPGPLSIPAIKSTRSTQPSIPLGEVNWIAACLAGIKSGCVHLCRVAGNTVWSHMASDTP